MRLIGSTQKKKKKKSLTEKKYYNIAVRVTLQDFAVSYWLLGTAKMSIALSQQSFLANALSTPSTHKSKTRILYSVKAISCRYPPHDHQDSPR